MFRHCIKSNLSVFPENYYDLTEDEKFGSLSNVKGNIDPNDFENEITKSTIESIQADKGNSGKMVNLVPIDI
jgi:phosphoenolpyruvate carboxylase